MSRKRDQKRPGKARKDQIPTGRISDIPSHTRVLKGLAAVEAIELLKSSFASKKNSLDPSLHSELSASIDEMNEHKWILNAGDEFNKRFLQRGWIFHKSIKTHATRLAIDLAKHGNYEASEQVLSDSIHVEDLTRLKRRMRGLNRASARENQMDECIKLYLDERYISLAPLLFVVCDGISADIIQVSMFSVSADLTAYDSVAGHPTGLPQLLKTVTKHRGKTSDMKIDFPYRNGIIHGRDLGYGNKLLCDKLWFLLFAVCEWALDKKTEQDRRGQNNAHVDQRSTEDIRARNEIDRQLASVFTKRDVSNPNIDSFRIGDPEFALCDLLNAWKKGQYGIISTKIDFHVKRTDAANAGYLKHLYGHLELREFRFLRIQHDTPSRAKITVELIVHNSATGILEHRTNQHILIRYNASNDFAMPSEEGIWKIPLSVFWAGSPPDL